VGAPLDEVVAWVRAEARIRPGFAELVAWARADGRRVAVVTSSFHELIEPVLGEDVELFANRLEARPDGWRVEFADLEDCETCGQPCKRASVARLGVPVVYVGDGYSVRCAAQAAERVFARDGLALYLSERGVEYEPFDDLNDVLDALERERLAA
jgi:2-hydroxy-3-keto-5-methylthiopentenyl-1-phosphate phosphatase